MKTVVLSVVALETAFAVALLVLGMPNPVNGCWVSWAGLGHFVVTCP